MITVRPVPASLPWDPLDLGGAGWCVRGEVELLFFDPAGHGGARSTKRACETAQTAPLLRGMQNLFAASFRVDVGSRPLAATTPTSMTAILLFSIGGHDRHVLASRFLSGHNEG
jgi:hypothetical protein